MVINSSFKLLKMPCFLINFPYTHLYVKVFMFLLHSREIKKSKTFIYAAFF